MQTPTHLFRIFTEDTGPRGHETALQLASKHADNFTVFFGEGCWKGGREPSLIIEVMECDGEIIDGDMRRLASALKLALQQECVLVQKIPLTYQMV